MDSSEHKEDTINNNFISTKISKNFIAPLGAPKQFYVIQTIQELDALIALNCHMHILFKYKASEFRELMKTAGKKLQYHRAYIQFDVSNSDFCDDDCSALYDLFSLNLNFYYFNCEQTRVTNKSMIPLAKTDGFARLNTLKIAYTHIDNQFFLAFLNHLQSQDSWNQLVNLDISGTLITDQIQNTLLELIKQNKLLQFFGFEATQLKIRTATMIMQELSSKNILKELKIGFNVLTDLALSSSEYFKLKQELIKAMVSIKSLTKLDVCNFQIFDELFYFFCENFGAENIQVLNLSGNQLTDRSSQVILRLLSHCPNLKEICLSGNMITDIGLRKILDGKIDKLKDSDVVKYINIKEVNIDLRFNQISNTEIYLSQLKFPNLQIYPNYNQQFTQSCSTGYRKKYFDLAQQKQTQNVCNEGTLFFVQSILDNDIQDQETQNIINDENADEAFSMMNISLNEAELQGIRQNTVQLEIDKLLDCQKIYTNDIEPLLGCVSRNKVNDIIQTSIYEVLVDDTLPSSVPKNLATNKQTISSKSIKRTQDNDFIINNYETKSMVYDAKQYQTFEIQQMTWSGFLLNSNDIIKEPRNISSVNALMIATEFHYDRQQKIDDFLQHSDVNLIDDFQNKVGVDQLSCDLSNLNSVVDAMQLDKSSIQELANSFVVFNQTLFQHQDKDSIVLDNKDEESESVSVQEIKEDQSRPKFLDALAELEKAEYQKLHQTAQGDVLVALQQGLREKLVIGQQNEFWENFNQKFPKYYTNHLTQKMEELLSQETDPLPQDENIWFQQSSFINLDDLAPSFVAGAVAKLRQTKSFQLYVGTDVTFDIVGSGRRLENAEPTLAFEGLASEKQYIDIDKTMLEELVSNGSISLISNTKLNIDGMTLTIVYQQQKEQCQTQFQLGAAFNFVRPNIPGSEESLFVVSDTQNTAIIRLDNTMEENFRAVLTIAVYMAVDAQAKEILDAPCKNPLFQVLEDSRQYQMNPQSQI